MQTPRPLALIYSLAAALVLAVWFSACVTAKYGTPFDVSKADGIVIGKSTKADVIAAIGQPHSNELLPLASSKDASAAPTEKWNYFYAVGNTFYESDRSTSTSLQGVELDITFTDDKVIDCIISGTATERQTFDGHVTASDQMTSRKRQRRCGDLPTTK